MLSDHTIYNFPRGSGDSQCVFNVKTIVRHHHAYQSALVAVSENLACQREGANSENPFAVAVMTGREKFLQFAQCFYDKIGQFSIDLLDLQFKDTVFGFLNSNFKRKNFVGTNFCELVFDGENCEVPHYTVFNEHCATYIHSHDAHMQV